MSKDEEKLNMETVTVSTKSGRKLFNVMQKTTNGFTLHLGIS